MARFSVVGQFNHDGNAYRWESYATDGDYPENVMTISKWTDNEWEFAARYSEAMDDDGIIEMFKDELEEQKILTK